MHSGADEQPAESFQIPFEREEDGQPIRDEAGHSSNDF